MILPFLLILLQASPEAEIVMDRKRLETRKAAPKLGVDEKVMRSDFVRPSGMQQKFELCMDAALDNPEAGVKQAEAWRMASGGYLARQCLGFAYAQQERWAPALVAFQQAADEADIAGDPASAQLWAQAGNAALAGGDPAKALNLFDAALARGLPDGFEKGEVYLDRARAHVALDQLSEARPDMDKALDQVPKDPLAWLLSATLARRVDNLSLAQAHIARAVALAKDDASVALEEGNIAMLSGAEDVSRLAWERAVRLAPNSPAGKAAAESLKRLGV
ncbi:tetratricopeptide repeat protein [Rhizorhapis suberifaciens]|uniref:Tetratricopeptide (TPR) repeat protein n=1 Tax=Rhizorhapis suberifaciens TaxID=13656 RepID=A0A840HTK2_9SPHN|nr:tetratricopeptide repeat protein [Rhizorhapis suberifaciens]MBB4640937.1 tetratricopeptide (TPR) repeat protein [Rhizorhapis suberifaciens]